VLNQGVSREDVWGVLGHRTTYSLTATKDGVNWSAARHDRCTPYGWPDPRSMKAHRKGGWGGEKSCPGIEHPSAAWSVKTLLINPRTRPSFIKIHTQLHVSAMLSRSYAVHDHMKRECTIAHMCTVVHSLRMA